MTDVFVDPTILRRLEQVERVLEAQREYIHRVPDPDNRYRAETNLLTLLEMRDSLRSGCQLSDA